MPYLGNTPTTQSFISGTDYFNGTGAQTAFTLSRTVASVNDIQAVVNNVVQVPNDAYTISGTTITFTSAPSAGTQNVYVRYLSTTTQAITPSQNTVSWSTLDSNVQGDLGISFKNRIINSNMVIDQRNAGASVTPTIDGTYTLDRWKAQLSSASKYSVQQNAGSVTPPAGFVNYLGATSLAATSLGATDYYFLTQQIEGYNIADLGYGTANAKTVTLSFWVRSSLTGTFGGALTNTSDAWCPFGYTISAANTWEQKTITIAGPTIGTWSTTNSSGLAIRFSLGIGSTFSGGTSGTWTSTIYSQVSGATSVVGTNGATFYLTGVQLEVGTQATTFTTAGGSYGAELVLCQRYCQRYRSAQAFDFYGMVSLEDSSTVNGSISFPTTMRSAPSATLSAGNTFRIYTTGGFTASAISFQSASINSAIFFLTVSGATGGQAGKWQDAGSNNSSIILSAEL